MLRMGFLRELLKDILSNLYRKNALANFYRIIDRFQMFFIIHRAVRIPKCSGFFFRGERVAK